MNFPSYVIAGPTDVEDGVLYWSNADGWGFLSTATIFTAQEFADGNLPFGDDARWVALDAARAAAANHLPRECTALGVDADGEPVHPDDGTKCPVHDPEN